MTYWAENWHTR